MQTLNLAQYQHLMDMLNTHLKAAKIDTGVDDNSGSVSGTCFSISNIPSLNSLKHWVVDSGATSHICSNKSTFHALKQVESAYVILPNHEKIYVHSI